MRRPNDVEQIQVANVMIWQIRERARTEGHDHDRQAQKEGIAFPNSVVNERSGERQSEGDSVGILTALAS